MKHFSLYKINLVIAILLAGFALSCKKLIEVPPAPPNEIGAPTVYATDATALAAMAGIYTQFGTTLYVNITMTNGGLDIYPGLSADELSDTQGDPQGLQFFNNSLLSSNSVLDGFWTSSYQNLYQVNDALTRIPASTGMSAPVKQQLIGELETIRAFYYFNLVNLFGSISGSASQGVSIPLVTSTNYETTGLLPRATTASVYAQIVADLTDATTKLTAAYPSAGHYRPNLYVAKALLAKVYLYQGQWAKAAIMAGDVIKNSGCDTTALNNVFLDGSPEAIWQLPSGQVVGQSETIDGYTFLYFTLFVPPSYTPEAPGYPLTSALDSAFENGDQRKLKWVNTATVNGTTYYYPFKYKVVTKSNTSANESFMLLRLGEQYLIRAEANAQQGSIDTADLNVIRNRAGLPAYAGATDQASVLAAIMHERRVELFCEWGNRWFDLKRTGTIKAVLGVEKPGWTSNDALYPIPQTERTGNPNLTQNGIY
jgi:starch-binding outer membrane protein, SusD/RagB family